MKKIFWIIAISAFSMGGFAQENVHKENAEPGKYCAEFKNGVLYVLHDGVKMEKDVKLGNGNVIHTDAVIETKDRFIVMKPDQCINVDGNLEGTKEEPVTTK